MSTAESSDHGLPGSLLAGMVLLVTLSIGAVAFVRLNEPVAGSDRVVDLVESRWLQFADADDGAVVVRDSVSGVQVGRFEPGTNGFARGLLRGLARDRRKHGLTMDLPLQLGRNTSGQVLLLDAHTSAYLDLNAFGPTNSAVFERLLDTAAGTASQETNL